METKIKKPDLYPLLVVTLATLSYVGILTLHDIYLDDNCWLLSAHVANGLQDFLANGFAQLRREPLGIFIYFFFLPQRLMGDQAFLIWHGITLAVQIATPVVLYYFVFNLAQGRRDIAVFVAATSVIITLDQTAPFLAAINYRIGLLLGLFSLYLTERAIHNKRIDRKKLAMALLISSVGEYIFIEGVIAFEPGRLLLLWFIRRRFDKSASVSMKQALITWLPFVVITTPLIIYKLLYKPYGIYENLYSTGLGYFTNWSAVQDMLQLFMLGHWRLLQDFAAHKTPLTIIFSLVAGALTLLILMRKEARQTFSRVTEDSKPQRTNNGWTDGPRFILILGIILLISQIVFFGFAGRFPSVGDRTTYAILMQPGYAMVIGSGIWWFINRFLIGSLKIKPLLSRILFAALSGLGIYYNNLNLDVYAAASLRNDVFWQTFSKRFPQLPEKADFFIDAAPSPYAGGQPTFFKMEGLHGVCGYELHLEQLYAGHNDIAASRRYRVVTVRSFAQAFRHEGPSILKMDLQLFSNFGMDLLHPAELIVVFYRDGELLVNREILEQYPTAPYRLWADKPLPAFAAPRERATK